jgi:RHS repeat-associated protein
MYDGTVQHASLTHKFTGKERDRESGLDNFGARYDSSSMGRFMSPDPLAGHVEDPQTLRRFVRTSFAILVFQYSEDWHALPQNFGID